MGNQCKREKVKISSYEKVTPVSATWHGQSSILIHPDKIFTRDDMASSNSIAFSPDGKLIAAASSSRVVLLDVSTGANVMEIKNDKENNLSIAFSPRGRLFAIGLSSGNIRLIHLDTREVIGTIGEMHSWPHYLSFSPEGYWLTTSSISKKAQLWNVLTRIQKYPFNGPTHNHHVSFSTFSPDGRFIASASDDIRIWNIQREETIAIMDEYDSEITFLSFFPSSAFIASGHKDGTIKIWNVYRNKLVATIDIGNSVHTLSVSPDGSILASASSDNKVRLWDTRKWRKVVSFEGRGFLHNPVCFSPDGRFIASSDLSSVVKIWKIERRVTENQKT